MQIEDFDYELPSELIAQHPLTDRDASKMLVLDTRHRVWVDRRFRELPEVLRGDELLVCNNARVIPARLLGHRLGVRSGRVPKPKRFRQQHLGSQIEVLLLRQIEADTWESLVRPGRKMSTDEHLVFGNGEIEAVVIGRGELGLRTIRLTVKGDLSAVLERIGHVPLPPYIGRPDEPSDRGRYQTIFAKRPGAIAAPTAGFHFSPQVVDRLKSRGVEICELTLEVGLGTFQPIRGDVVEGHRMHSESYDIPESTAVAIQEARRTGRPVLAIGTTVVRALESAAAAGREKRSAARLSQGSRELEILPGRGETNLFIYPGYEFQVANQLLTNFHLPRSSLLVLVAAFAGRDFLLRAYRQAVEAKYRFYSYGDCMLIR